MLLVHLQIAAREGKSLLVVRLVGSSDAFGTDLNIALSPTDGAGQVPFYVVAGPAFECLDLVF